ncbi:bilin-binding protein-like [Aricia agestis]|uniref:bilin-binding protein-like n=1 Tax=Aricia agestis TaxID=91739 RepID=UPI001C2090C0|nr:bilin-binding protein-like [Aricia agestis]
MSKFVISCIFFLAVAHAQKCPKVDLLENFDLSKYAQGAWYEIARYNNSVERYGNCVVSNYTRSDNDYVIEVTEIQDGKKIVYDGIVDVSTDEHRKGNITYIFLDNNITYRYSMIFLSVDYDSYALKYSCQYDPNTKSSLVFAWIYSKTPKLSDSAKATIDSYLATSKLLDRSKFYWDAFSDDACRFNTTSIDRTLPSRMKN